MNETISKGAPGIPPEALAVLKETADAKRRFRRNNALALFTLLMMLFGFLYMLGLDFAFMARWFGFIMAGMGYTLLVSFLAISLACILSVIGALGRLSRNPIANSVATAYVSFIRGTPLLVQVYMWYLALPQIGKSLEEMGVHGAQAWFTLPAIAAGVLALGVCYGAYMTETVRAGIESIGIGQREAAKALGMTDSQMMRRIIFPQALRVIIPPISNEFIAMIKDSSLVSLMGVWELSYRAIKVGRRYFQSLEMLILAALIYWVLCIILQTVQEHIEARMAKGDRGVNG
ncbi:polar amino acid transport system permease protein [Desulfacinum infernum DSM 9756]|uniref:Polar amino acid transport system permease protein n=1 Tax=Desulfacinum infernum DSM 9756 TaxID=1121391 RepID=A0A1M5CG84_9BACT|nr:amino acid ABC transporter permease [Desulfacinum infernum]SHF53700.1 polar amino acid transport system permease protein [Desulfacinum infernum DSM 9756]